MKDPIIECFESMEMQKKNKIKRIVSDKKRQKIIKEFKEKELYDEETDTLFFDESIKQHVRTSYNRLGFKVSVINKKPRGLSVKNTLSHQNIITSPSNEF
jgi:hypothetical protein